MPKIEQEYIRTGLVKFVFRDLPLQQVHPNAFRAAEAANCAGAQDKYWPMHDLLFQNYRQLTEENFKRFATQLELDTAQFEQCLQNNQFKTEVEQDLRDAQQLGINGTPIFLIGVTEPNSQTIKIVQSLRGAQPYERFKAALDEALKD